MLRLSLPLLIVLIVVSLAACTEGTAHLTGQDARIDISQVKLDPEEARAMINRYRAEKGKKPLALNPVLTRAAQRHSTDLAKQDTISHSGSDGSNPWKRVTGAGYHAQLAAENVGAGQRSMAEVFRGWQESPGHDRNLLLADATQMGIALTVDAGTRYGTFWTLVIGTPM